MLSKILDYLPPHELVKSALVCKSFHKVASEKLSSYKVSTFFAHFFLFGELVHILPEDENHKKLLIDIAIRIKKCDDKAMPWCDVTAPKNTSQSLVSSVFESIAANFWARSNYDKMRHALIEMDHRNNTFYCLQFRPQEFSQFDHYGVSRLPPLKRIAIVTPFNYENVIESFLHKENEFDELSLCRSLCSNKFFLTKLLEISSSLTIRTVQLSSIVLFDENDFKPDFAFLLEIFKRMKNLKHIKFSAFQINDVDVHLLAEFIKCSKSLHSLEGITFVKENNLTNHALIEMAEAIREVYPFKFEIMFESSELIFDGLKAIKTVKEQVRDKKFIKIKSLI